jgi:hypothetical protein
MWRRLRARQATPGQVEAGASSAPVARIVDPAVQDVDAARSAEPAATARKGFPLIGWVLIILGLVGALGAGALWAAENLKFFAPKPTAPTLASPAPILAPPTPAVSPPPVAVAPAPVTPAAPPPSALPPSAPAVVAPQVVSAPPPTAGASPSASAKHRRKPSAASGTMAYKRVITPDGGPPPRPSSAVEPASPPSAAPAPQTPAKKPGFLHRLFLGSGQPKPPEGSGESAPQN